MRVPTTKIRVLNMRGQPLMPCRPQKARKLLVTEKAKIKTHNPFTIQLIQATGETKQIANIGTDPGTKHVALTVVSEKEDLFSCELIMDQGVSKRVQQRAMFRRSRRNCLWYRKSRFNNRVRPAGWLPPSIEHKVQTHKNLIMKIKSLYPITNIYMEVSKFDTQKIENPDIKGVEYQHGTLQGYEIKEYLLNKFNHKCAYCKRSNLPLEVEHIVPKSRGGTNRISNLVISCHDCNQKKGSQTAKEFGYSDIQKQVKKSLKAATQMNIITKCLLEDSELDITPVPAYETKFRRKQLNLEKSHVNDAFVIAGGTTQIRSQLYQVKQTRRNNRKLQQNRRRFGFSIRQKRHPIQTNDLIEYRARGDEKSRLFRVSLGGSESLEIWDAKFDKYRNPKVSKVRLICSGKGLNFSIN